MRYRHDGFRALEQARRVAEGNGPVAFEDSDPASDLRVDGLEDEADAGVSKLRGLVVAERADIARPLRR